MKLFSHIKLDSKNPMVKRDETFRKLMVERKKIHTLFDMIQCSKWNKIFEHGNLRSLDSNDKDTNIKDYKNLVLRDNIFKVSHLRNMEVTIKKI